MESVIEFARQFPEEILALTALGTLVVSTISIGVAFLAILTQRRHDRAAVRPMAHVFVGDYIDDIYVGLENVGLGPMEIESVTFSKAHADPTSTLIEGMADLTSGLVWADFSGEMQGRFFSPASKMNFIRLVGDDTAPEFVRNRDTVRAELKDYAVKVVFKDVFGKKFTYKRDLDWFGRPN